MSDGEWVALATIAVATITSLHARVLWSLHGKMSRIDQKVETFTEEARRNEAHHSEIRERIDNHERRMIVQEQRE